MAAFILILLILLMLGSNEAIGYYYSHCDGDEIFDCVMESLNEPEEEEKEGVTAVGTYTYKDYPVTITMNIPLDGGNVTGAVSGTCEGSVKGTFSGQNNGVISGRLAGTCSPFFVNIPSSADFTGSVSKPGKTVPISFEGRGAGFTHNGSMTLTYK